MARHRWWGLTVALVGTVALSAGTAVAVVWTHDRIQASSQSDSSASIPWRDAIPSNGPFVPDAANPTRKNTHWHAALGVFDCDHWLGDNSNGPGTWNWPAATPSGEPARADNTNMYAGLHSHDDGVIHMEPAVSSEAGVNATVGLYFAYGGWKLSADGYSFLGATVKNGEKCGDSPGTLEWAIGNWDGTSGKQKMTVHRGDPSEYKLHDGDIVVIAFLPKGKTIASVGNPPSLPRLGSALGVEGVPPGGSSPILPPATVTSP